MVRRRSCTHRLAPAILLALTLAPGGAAAGDWHRDHSLVCSDCHTMHNSKGGEPMRYDRLDASASRLLRAEGATAVCLACHRGDRPSSSAPSVAAPTNWDPPGGGFPADLSDPAHHAHALGGAPLVPPEGSDPVAMACVTCHDPHGNANYRNLRDDPTGVGRPSAAPVVHQKVTAGSGRPAEVYLRSNVTYVSGMSQWCMSCHDRLASSHAAADPLLAAHPWDRALFNSTADYAAWQALTGARVPVQNAAGRPAPDEGDQVFCLSCHKAHGSPNDAALVHVDGATRSSTCQQCHNL